MSEPQTIDPFEILKVLLVDPEKESAKFSKMNLEKGYDVSVDITQTGNEALTYGQRQAFDAVVSAFDMSDMNGMDLHHSHIR